jgi:hypothetical protein
MPNVNQLNMIQAVINRLAGNSFLLKGWTVTLMAGLLGFASANSSRGFALIAVFVVIVLGTLDAYYLALERAYRELYDREAARQDATSWTLKAPPVGRGDVLDALSSISISGFYGAVLLVTVGVAIGV